VTGAHGRATTRPLADLGVNPGSAGGLFCGLDGPMPPTGLLYLDEIYLI
jgi:hypothetical protein